MVVASILYAQEDDHHWCGEPVRHGMRLAGTFGELRSNHFHTGIDIKSSNGRVGDPIYAAADGYVSRIRISKTGYGQVLYLDHPNGYTTVYAHLHRFNDELESFTETLQYAKKTFEFDTTVVAGRFPVKKGQQIGTMGSSGRSYGPHLHFEIRETASERPINPLLFDLEIVDRQAPRVHYVQVNYLDQQHLKYNSKKIALKKQGNNYRPLQSTIKIPSWRVGLGVYVRDLMTGISNKNGIYKGELFVDDKKVFAFQMDTISFDEFRYLNGHIDYEHFNKKRHRMHLMYKKPGNNASIYTTNLPESIIKLYQEKKRHIEIKLSDFNENVSTIKFTMLRDTNMTPYKERNFQYYLEPGKPHIIDQNTVKLKFDSTNLYEPLYLSIDHGAEREIHCASGVHHIGDDDIPIFGSYDIFMKPTVMDSSLYEDKKYLIAACKKKSYVSYGGKNFKGYVGTKVSSLGSFVLMIDTIPPSITPISTPYEVRRGSKIVFKIDDNLPVRGRARDLRYAAYLDGKWILMKYDLKTKRISHIVDDRWSYGKHKLVVVVQDDRGNKKQWSKSFIRK